VEACLGLGSCIMEFKVVSFLEAQYKIQTEGIHSRTEVSRTLPWYR
jgi:hypothetical protein